MLEHVSLDGVIQAPGGPDEDTSNGFAHSGWMVNALWLMIDGTIPAAFKVTESKVTPKGVIVVNYERAGSRAFEAPTL